LLRFIVPATEPSLSIVRFELTFVIPFSPEIALLNVPDRFMIPLFVIVPPRLEVFAVNSPDDTVKF